ncbi:ABC transporter permease [Blastococcus sp. MG754426]|uniref:ABC transporter permease n=2 Tax=Geodermatophilaceae TaxID=85030 RepID=A0ABU8E517_9ACTN|nr:MULTISPECIES: ABC transporter permease [Geodermatophilaceae]MCF6506726.1 ABC transporter permease [Blastococcus sp. MG754426]MCF6511537.1 ABC transporter permease [Blastococcus sp. MG754427]SOC53029.1 putative ABC transport system permease protein [Blastococcus aggregatus]
MFVAWRDLRFAKGRFVLMGAVVVLITVLVGLVSGLTAGLARANTSAITDLPADSLAFAAPADGEGFSFTVSSVDADTWTAWERVPGVTSAEPLGILTTRAQTDGRTASVSAFGVQAGSGLAPSAGQVRDGAVVLSTAAADELEARIGDTVTVAGQELRVADIAGDASYSHTPVMWTSLDDFQALTGSTGDDDPSATVIALTTTSDADLAAADAELGTTTVSRDDALSAIGSFTSENGSLQLMRGFLFAISALVIGAFFTVWTIQRSGDIAVLKALGASTGYLLRDALGQAVVLLVLGTVAGTAIAVAAGAALGHAVPFVLDLATVAVPALVMIALGVAGAALSIRRITSVDPLTALGSAR